MAIAPRGLGSSAIEREDGSPADPTPISALFLIYFDTKAGYTIIWKRAIAGLQLEGVVEYKSLPSGLHTVRADLIYFTHDEHIGVSAFVNAPAAEESRNARMIAVGVLVPYAPGRSSQVWGHAAALQKFGQQLVQDTTKTQALEEYWEKHRVRDGNERQATRLPASCDGTASSTLEDVVPATYVRSRHRNESLGPATPLILDASGEHHPMRSMSSLLDTFGPLLFPVYRAALLRKRILISCNAPVHEICNFVYNISLLSNVAMLSNVANSVGDLHKKPSSAQQLCPIFTIGVHDIPFLEIGARRLQENASTDIQQHQLGTNSAEYEEGFIACTTDAILATKTSLYDVLVTMPQQPDFPSSHQISWPMLENTRGQTVLATQRDLRRYRNLRVRLSNDGEDGTRTDRSEDRFSDDVGGRLFPQSVSAAAQPSERHALNRSDINAVVEPVSWSALTYDGYMWWTSAAERQAAADEELQHDTALFESMVDESLFQEITSPAAMGAPPNPTTESFAKQETAIVEYFHRLTLSMLSTISDVVGVVAPSCGGDDVTVHNDEAVDEAASRCDLSSDTMMKMGLDPWSPNDHTFVKELTKTYFARDAVIHGRTVDICGVRIC